MAGPIDIENQPPDPNQRPKNPVPPSAVQPPAPQGQLPTNRASDLLRSPQTFSGLPSGDPIRPDADRRATPFDDAASGLFTVCALLFCFGLAYLLWGMWTGAFANPNWTSTYAHADRMRADGNIHICSQFMWGGLAFGVALFLFLFYHEDYAGYALLGAAILMQVGIPYLTSCIYNSRSFGVTEATTGIFALLNSLSWIAGIPGIILVCFNIVTSLSTGLQNAKTRRATFKFGQQAVKDVKSRNVFLGHCWNLPYCKQSIRSKCPIFIAKNGPCWRNKRGCMCDQTILLVAQSPNWKQSVSATVSSLERKSGGPAMPELPPQPHMSKEAKNERCRQCVIYNVHQEQKYKLFVGLVLGGTVAAVAAFYQPLASTTGDLFMKANVLVGRFSISTNTAPLFPNGAPSFVVWLILGSVILVIVSKLLQVVEFFCFKLKV